MDGYKDRVSQEMDRKEFNEVYKSLFKRIMLKYSSNYDKNMVSFLESRIKDNPNYDEHLF